MRVLMVSMGMVTHTAAPLARAPSIKVSKGVGSLLLSFTAAIRQRLKDSKKAHDSA
jgi:hypothetical protein